MIREKIAIQKIFLIKLLYRHIHILLIQDIEGGSKYKSAIYTIYIHT